MVVDYLIVWEPVTGCTPHSPGCQNCYMKRESLYLQELKNPRYRNGFNLTIHPREITKLGAFIKNTALIQICGNSDLFHKDVPERFILNVLRESNRYSWQHWYMILTKRSERLLEISKKLGAMFDGKTQNYRIGVSVESPAYYHRIHDLQKVRANNRFLSLAPFLEAMPGLPLEGISSVSLLEEIGPDARPVHEDASYEIWQQCHAAEVEFSETCKDYDQKFEIFEDGLAIGRGPTGFWRPAMEYQLIERTGGLQVLPLLGNPKAYDFLKLRKKLAPLNDFEVQELVRHEAPEFFED